ncbi:MAG: FAD-dependent oxidoreductase [Ectothiorhodospiraceae bacterium AqS1]|nr:FAD-dependent oxidoreductase [Ectothiorhodospiraceae bacterium AqS1]MBF2761356.1 FAD-dependent oxidoreductase [Ectothiorhodospiraceae bacterium AqS1]
MSPEQVTQALPSHASVVVIGGGVMGCSTLYHLAKSGVSDAVLLERNKLTSGTTWHSAAQVRALRSTRNLTDLVRYSIDLYSRLEAETGQQVGWICKGSLSIATNEDRMIHIRRQAALAGLFGVRAQTISAGEAAARWPLMNADDIVGAVWSPDDGRVGPSDLCAALVKGARSAGARIFEDTGVIGIHTEGGRIRSLETERGPIRTEAVALCTGLWSRSAAAMAGVEVPVWPCEHFYLLTKAVPGTEGNLPTLSDHDGHLYIRDDSGGLLIGCFEPMGKPIDPDLLGPDFAFGLLDEDWDHFEPMMRNALHRLPCLAEVEAKMLLNGPESFTPDGGFLLGEAAKTRGLFLGCGMNSVGVATGGGAGMALAHTIVHGAPPMDLHEADPKRFDSAVNSVQALVARVPEVLGRHYEIAYPGRQWRGARDLKTLPLHRIWKEKGAHFGQVFGYERPLYFAKTQEPRLRFSKPDWFEQVGAEVAAAHEGVGITEISSFGKIEISGPDALACLEVLCTNRIDRPSNRACYTLMLNEAGGIESDLTVFRLGTNRFRLMTGSAAIKRDLAWIRNHCPTEAAIAISDVTDDLAVLGLCGPRTPRLAEDIGAGWLNDIGYFAHAMGMIGAVRVRAARLSYVGEAGWELTCKAGDAESLFATLEAEGAAPVGAFAQTSMRIEKGFLAYGHDLDTDMTPAMAGLEFAVAKDKAFIGSQALADKGAPTKRIASLAFKDTEALPLGNEPVLAAGRIVGKTTSAAFGYRIGRPVALALLDSDSITDSTATGASLQVDIAGTPFTCTPSTTALFDPKGDRMRKAMG